VHNSLKASAKTRMGQTMPSRATEKRFAPRKVEIAIKRLGEAPSERVRLRHEPGALTEP